MTLFSGTRNFVILAVTTLATPSLAEASGWAIWVNLEHSPHSVAVSPPGSMEAPWELEGGSFGEIGDAWKRACWLTRNGNIYGQMFVATAITSGDVRCDDNCNCGS